MTKYYFENISSEMCYDRSFFNDLMHLKEIDEIIVYEALPDRIKGIFWCKKEMAYGNNGDHICGKNCNSYKPRNGINGCCKYYSKQLYIHGDRIKLYLNKRY